MSTLHWQNNHETLLTYYLCFTKYFHYLCFGNYYLAMKQFEKVSSTSIKQTDIIHSTHLSRLYSNGRRVAGTGEAQAVQGLSRQWVAFRPCGHQMPSYASLVFQWEYIVQCFMDRSIQSRLCSMITGSVAIGRNTLLSEEHMANSIFLHTGLTSNKK